MFGSAVRARPDVVGGEHGGLFGSLRGFFAGLPPTAYASAMTKSHVESSALGAGYMVFFFYSGLVGVASMILAVLVYRTQRSARARTS